MMIVKQPSSRKGLGKVVAAALCAGLALTTSILDAAAAQRGGARIVRDHRASSMPVVRDHRGPSAPVLRESRVNRTTPPIVRDHRAGAEPKRKVIRAGRNYDKVTGRRVVIENGRRVVRSTRGPIIRDHRSR